jgi:Fe-S-cluster-containing hydrogenase component 2
MPDILTMMSLIKGIESAELTVHQERCVKVRNRNSQCRRCADVCTSGALSFGEGALLVSAELCVGCGTCASVCPTTALEARSPTDGELTRACVEVLQRDGGDVALACEPMLHALKDRYDCSRVVAVRCLGRIDESALAFLVTRGAQSITLLRDDCDNCPQGKGEHTCLLMLDSFETLMRAWGHKNPVTLSREIPDSIRLEKPRAPRASDDVNGISRRQFFTQLKDNARQVVSEATQQHLASRDPVRPGLGDADDERAKLPVARVMRDGTLPHFIPNRRERLLDWLDQLGQPETEYLDTRLWGHVEIDADLCDSCRMCATFCPTGAIGKFDDPDGSFGIEHYPADCVQCRLCQDICPTGAIQLDSRVPVKELVEGVIETHVMRPQLRKPSAPDSIMVSIKQLLGDNNINDRP